MLEVPRAAEPSIQERVSLGIQYSYRYIYICIYMYTPLTLSPKPLFIYPMFFELQAVILGRREVSVGIGFMIGVVEHHKDCRGKALVKIPGCNSEDELQTSKPTALVFGLSLKAIDGFGASRSAVSNAVGLASLIGRRCVIRRLDLAYVPSLLGCLLSPSPSAVVCTIGGPASFKGMPVLYWV